MRAGLRPPALDSLGQGPETGQQEPGAGVCQDVPLSHDDLSALEQWLRDDLDEPDPGVDVLALLERRQQRGDAR